MTKSRRKSGKAQTQIPRGFNPRKYEFHGDFSVWMSALACRVALRREIDELLTWRSRVEEELGQRLEVEEPTEQSVQATDLPAQQAQESDVPAIQVQECDSSERNVQASNLPEQSEQSEQSGKSTDFSEQQAKESDLSERQLSAEAFLKQRSVIYRAWRSKIKDKVLSLIVNPIPAPVGDNTISEKNCGDLNPVEITDLSEDASGESNFPEYKSYLQQSQPISDRLIVDDQRSSAKLRDPFYKNLFDLEAEKLEKSRPREKLLEMLGGNFLMLSLPTSTGDSQEFLESFEMWRADIQMPDFSGEFGVKVNLLYDDNVLCNAFSDWLKRTRASANFHMANRKVVTDDTLAEWSRMRVLPYIDLWLYQQVFDVKFTWKDIGEGLYGWDKEDLGGWDYEKRAITAHQRAVEVTRLSVFYSLRYQSS